MKTAVGQILKSRRFIIAVLLLLVLVAGAGLRRIQIGVDPASWVDSPEDSLLVRDIHNRLFGDPEMVCILVEAENVLSPVVLDHLQDLTDSLKSEVPYVRNVISAVDQMFHILSMSSLYQGNEVTAFNAAEHDQVENLERLMQFPDHPAHHLISPDRHSTVVYITFESIPEDMSGSSRLDSLYKIGKSVQSVLDGIRTDGITVSASGIPVVTYEQPRYFGKISTVLLFTTFLLVAAAVGIITRSFRVTFTVLTGAILPVLFVFAAYAYTGVLIEATLITVPCLLGFSLGVGYAVHYYHRLQAITGGKVVNGKDLSEAMADSFLPILFAGLTTAAAMLSFNVLALQPIRWTGNCSAIIVLVSVGMSLLLPALTYPGCRLPPPRMQRGFPSEGLGQLVETHRRMIIIAAITACAIGAGLANQIRIGGDSNDLIGPRVPYVREMNRIVESGTGSSYTFTVLVIPHDAEVSRSDAQLLETAGKVERHLLAEGFGKRVHSVFDVLRPVQGIRDGIFEKDLPSPVGAVSPGSLALLRRLQPALLVDWIDPDTDILRFIVEVDKYDPVQLTRKLDHLLDRTEETIDSSSVQVIGQIVDFAAMQNNLIRDQFHSLGLSLLAIYALLTLVFRSPLLGAVGMIPNLVPIVMIAGLMGAFRISLDSVTLTIMPMVLGISVDDTVHFIHHYRVARKSVSPREAILRTYRISGRGIVLTTLFLVAGFSSYLAGPPRFMLVMGLLVILGLLAALAADLLLLPAIFSSAILEPGGKGRKFDRVPH